MRSWPALVATILTAVAAPAADAPPPPALAPNGPWVVEAQENLCILSRTYGAGNAKVTVGFQPYFDNSQKMELMVLTQDASSDQRVGKATVSAGSSGDSLDAEYFSVSLRDGRRFARLTLSGELMRSVATAPALTIKAGKTAFTARIGAAAKALAALATCQHDLLVSWGVDPTLIGTGHAPNPHGAERQFGPNMYPPAAVRAGIQGRVVSMLQVDATGAVSACRIVATAGTVLNEATCAAARRIRFTPAHDDSGKAVPSIYVLPVRWVLPRD